MSARCKSNVLRLSFQGPLFPQASRAVNWAGLLPCGTGDLFPASPSHLCPLCRTRRQRSVCYQAGNRLLSMCVPGASVCFQGEYMGLRSPWLLSCCLAGPRWQTACSQGQGP